MSNIREGEDDSVSPVGLTSDNYAGLIFWDAETWMFPTLLALYPDIAESVLEYRYRTLPGARANAERLGYQGVFSVERRQQRRPRDRVPQRRSATLHHPDPPAGASPSSGRGRVTANADGRYSLTNVAGPDEYSNGVDDAVYTNAVASLALRNASRAAQILGEAAPAQWMTIADNLRMPFDEQQQVFLQYDGYDGSLIKQADTVLLIYPVEWPMSADVASNTLDFYAERTDPDGPAMTDSVHAIDAAAIGEVAPNADGTLRRPVQARYVRVELTQAASGERTGIRELQVIGR